jgi:hypothetical protein
MKRSVPLKIVTILGLVFCFSLFLVLAPAVPGEAVEYYTYKDPHGDLVISNKVPPTGSVILKRHDLPEAADPQNKQPRKRADTQRNVTSQGSSKPSKDR